MTVLDDLEVSRVVNAAGKMTALGGTAQNADVASALAHAASIHVDMREFRDQAQKRIAGLCGAEAACITTGAAAGIAIGIAAFLTRGDRELVRQLPVFDGPRRVLLQAGHDVNFGAEVCQMIRLGGGEPVVFGSNEQVTQDDLDAVLDDDVAALVYVKSHHCIQEHRLGIDTFLATGKPLLVDAAAESDLTQFIRRGVDLATYSGGKAIGGPTVGFLCGKAEWIDACEAQNDGIARAMKVGKEQIAGLLRALDRYDQDAPPVDRSTELRLALADLDELGIDVSVMPDRAGRPINRVAIRDERVRELVAFLASGRPSIRTRNHQLDDSLVLFDTREVRDEDIALIAARVHEFFET